MGYEVVQQGADRVDDALTPKGGEGDWGQIVALLVK
jgi:hypothetical protein